VLESKEGDSKIMGTRREGVGIGRGGRKIMGVAGRERCWNEKPVTG